MIDEVPEDFVDFVSLPAPRELRLPDRRRRPAISTFWSGRPRRTPSVSSARFGAPLAAHDVSANDFVVAGMVYQMGLPPNRIDILTEISGMSYDEAASDTIAGRLGPELVRCIGLDAMIRNKRAAGRAKDIADAETLEEIRARRASP